MAASILSQDMVAICLFLADGNLDTSLEEILKRVEHFQRKQDRHFGISKDDFRNLFYKLTIFELEKKQLDDLKLGDIIVYILEHHYVHFNDEGDHWVKESQSDFKQVEYWYGYDAKRYLEKLKLKQKMDLIFNSEEINSVDLSLVKKVMEETKIIGDILYQCSRMSKSS